MSFNAIRENKILAKVSGFTVNRLKTCMICLKRNSLKYLKTNEAMIKHFRDDVIGIHMTAYLPHTLPTVTGISSRCSR